jgi:hypothetical protein
MSIIDWLILVPAIPLIPVLVTWWLPWERWIPWARISKKIAGPFLFYLSFVEWHFRFNTWAVLLTALGALIVSVQAVREMVRGRQSDSLPAD